MASKSKEMERIIAQKKNMIAVNLKHDEDGFKT